MVEGGLQISWPMLVTGDGTKIVAPTSTTIVVRPAPFSSHSPQARRLLHQARLRNATVRKDRAEHASSQVQRQAQHQLGQALRAWSSAISPTYVVESAIAEFSVRTGKPVHVMDIDRLPLAQQGWTAVQWVGTSGSSAIVIVPGPVVSGMAQPVVGVQDGATFTPLPAAVQHALAEQIAW